VADSPAYVTDTLGLKSGHPIEGLPAMSRAHSHTFLSKDDYLRQEELASTGHGLVDGEMHTMAATSEQYTGLLIV